MVVRIIKFNIYMEGNRSLKEKKHQIKSLIDKIKSRFPSIAIAEVDSLDKWNKSTIGFSLVSNKVSFAESKLDQIFFNIQQISDFYISDICKDIIHF
ncbi:MAG: DUF503 domain-containing protein [Thermodesulfobacteriota bacterium]